MQQLKQILAHFEDHVAFWRCTDILDRCAYRHALLRYLSLWYAYYTNAI